MDPILGVLFRTTACTVLAATLAMLLLSKCRFRSPTLYRAVWVIVLLQGWAFFPLTLEFSIKSDVPTTLARGGSVAIEQSVSAEPQPVLADDFTCEEPANFLAACLPWRWPVVRDPGGRRTERLCGCHDGTAALRL